MEIVEGRPFAPQTRFVGVTAWGSFVGCTSHRRAFFLAGFFVFLAAPFRARFGGRVAAVPTRTTRSGFSTSPSDSSMLAARLLGLSVHRLMTTTRYR